MRSRPRPIAIMRLLELQPCGPGAIGDLFDAAVIEKSVSVEDHLRDAAIDAELADQLAEAAGSGAIAGRTLAAAESGGRGERPSCLIRNHLDVHVTVTAIDTQPRPHLRPSYPCANPLLPALARRSDVTR